MVLSASSFADNSGESSSRMGPALIALVAVQRGKIERLFRLKLRRRRKDRVHGKLASSRVLFNPEVRRALGDRQVQ
jgi:hypothetical protein